MRDQAIDRSSPSVRFMVYDKQNLRISMGRDAHTRFWIFDTHSTRAEKETHCQIPNADDPIPFPLPRHVQNMH